MSGITGSHARAVADLVEGHILAAVEIAAPPERVFGAIASQEITTWWVRPGIFDTRDWVGDVRRGGRWRAAGMTRGQPYAQEGEFLEVEPPRLLIHTWDGAGKAGVPSTVTYVLERIESGTRLTLRHAGFAARDMCNAFALGWETSLERLAEVLAPEFSLDRS
jgi:uncharacterized protein YndB with AHSA1/START domain